jgi:hypothetical protein
MYFQSFTRFTTNMSLEALFIWVYDVAVRPLLWVKFLHAVLGHEFEQRRRLSSRLRPEEGSPAALEWCGSISITGPMREQERTAGERVNKRDRGRAVPHAVSIPTGAHARGKVANGRGHGRPRGNEALYQSAMILPVDSDSKKLMSC